AVPANSEVPSRGHDRLGGTIPPFDPTNSGAPAGGTGSPAVGLSNAPVLRQPDEFGYKVKGVILGDKPMAVFEDDNGNQRLVPLGGSVDGDSRVIGIEKGKVRVKHRGKPQSLRLPEGP